MNFRTLALVAGALLATALLGQRLAGPAHTAAESSAPALPRLSVYPPARADLGGVEANPTTAAAAPASPPQTDPLDAHYAYRPKSERVCQGEIGVTGSNGVTQSLKNCWDQRVETTYLERYSDDELQQLIREQQPDATTAKAILGLRYIEQGKHAQGGALLLGHVKETGKPGILHNAAWHLKGSDDPVDLKLDYEFVILLVEGGMAGYEAGMIEKTRRMLVVEGIDEAELRAIEVRAAEFL